MLLKDRISAVARLEDVVGRYVKVEKKGAALVACCPFHDDHHPSLSIHPGKQIFKCYACGEGGDLFTFVQKMEHCTFAEALRKLAGWYGIPCSNDRPQALAVPPKKASSAPAAEAVAGEVTTPDEYLRVLSQLRRYEPEEEALKEAYRRFQVGMAPDELPRSLAFLRGRLVFPIRDETSRLVAFAGRRIDGEGEGEPAAKEQAPKYINSPTGPLYRKSEVLYGLFLAREEAERQQAMYVCEGYKDALAMHAAGFANSVALCGTAFTDEQIRLLARYCRRIVLVLDGDEAGRRAAGKYLPLIRRRGLDCQQITLPDGHDPDSFFRLLGCEGFARYVAYHSRKQACYAEINLLALCLRHPDFRTEDDQGRITLLPLRIETALAADDIAFEDEENRLILHCLAGGEREADLPPYLRYICNDVKEVCPPPSAPADVPEALWMCNGEESELLAQQAECAYLEYGEERLLRMLSALVKRRNEAADPSTRTRLGNEAAAVHDLLANVTVELKRNVVSLLKSSPR